MNESRPGYLQMKFQVAQQFVAANGAGSKQAIPTEEMIAIIEGQPTEEQKAKAEKVIEQLHEAWRRDNTPASLNPSSEIHVFNREANRVSSEATRRATYTGRKVEEEIRITKTR